MFAKCKFVLRICVILGFRFIIILILFFFGWCSSPPHSPGQ